MQRQLKDETIIITFWDSVRLILDILRYIITYIILQLFAEKIAPLVTKDHVMRVLLGATQKMAFKSNASKQVETDKVCGNILIQNLPFAWLLLSTDRPAWPSWHSVSSRKRFCSPPTRCVNPSGVDLNIPGVIIISILYEGAVTVPSNAFGELGSMGARSIPYLLMPWLLASPGHQRAWYWLYSKLVSILHEKWFEIPARS